ncbi:hypothetical protein ACFLIM_45870 [Nonomuraea sp. M3C6]|uniref:Uncharacterized protein n=1 Tax=Nonomuraea marmarensis TaxID=3351344 RepID=A0ABW7ATY0_9ACTN
MLTAVPTWNEYVLTRVSISDRPLFITADRAGAADLQRGAEVQRVDILPA